MAVFQSLVSVIKPYEIKFPLAIIITAVFKNENLVTMDIFATVERNYSTKQESLEKNNKVSCMAKFPTPRTGQLSLLPSE
jgi:hypothetical protein